MRSMSANDAKKNFGQLIDTARREPVTIEKHGRPVTVMMSVEDFEDLTGHRQQWLHDNKAALESSNEHVEKHGLPLARHRQF